MFKKSVGQRIAISRHKHLVIAAIAISTMLLLYAFPAQQLASATLIIVVPPDEIEQEPEFGDQDLAQRLVDDTRQRTDQEAEQRQTQEQEQEIEQELEQSNEADIDQSEENNQANVIETGDNTATATQIGDNDAIGNDMAAESEGGSGEASASIEQSVENEATTEQDSSADENVLVNENTFGDDIAVVDQDNTADQDAVNVGIQEQEQDLIQEAVNVDVNRQVAEQVQTATIGTPTQPPPDDGEDGVFCLTTDVEGNVDISCFETRAECETAEDIFDARPEFTIVERCEEFPTIPPGGQLCTIDPGGGSISCTAVG